LLPILLLLCGRMMTWGRFTGVRYTWRFSLCSLVWRRRFSIGRWCGTSRT
jgi:hypothetical protein